MMKLSLMQDFFKKVDEKGNSSIGNEIVKAWNHDEGTLKAFNASANFLCIFKYNDKPYFLRFNHESERNRGYIENEILLIQYLLDNGIKISKPLLSKNNQYVETVETELGIFHAVVFEAVRGNIYDTEELTLTQIHKWGQSLGELHKILKTLPLNTIKRPSVFDQINDVLAFCNNDTIIRDEIHNLKLACAKLSMDKNHYGVIHYDFEADNIIFTEDDIVSIDYDDCCYHFYMGDIVYALRDFFVEDKLVEKDKFLAFIKGYQDKTDLDEQMLETIPLMHRLHHVYQYIRLLRAVDLEESDSNLEWMNGLIQKLNNKMKELFRGFIHDKD